MTSNTAFGHNVISLLRFQADPKFPVLRQVEAYWQALRAGRDVPLRSDVDPRGMETALENAFVLEKIAPGLARFRLAGMHLVDLMGMEVRGMPITAMFTPDARHKVQDALDKVFEYPEIVELYLEAEKGIGKPALEARMLLLPLKSDLGEVTRVLGCLVSDGKIGRAPRRFNITGSKRTQIGIHIPSEAQARPAPAAQTNVQKTPQGTGTTSDGFEADLADATGLRPVDAAGAPIPRRRNPDARPHLRLVKSDA